MAAFIPVAATAGTEQTVDFSHTLLWGGFSSVTDVYGNPVALSSSLGQTMIRKVAHTSITQTWPTGQRPTTNRSGRTPDGEKVVVSGILKS